MKNQAEMTGILRGDIKLLHGENLLLFDPAADCYYKISDRMAEIISYFSEDMPLETMLEKLADNGVTASLEELRSICLFLRSNSLLIPRYGETQMRRLQLEEMKKKTFFLRLSSAYLFFKLPPWRPEKFFRTAAPYVSFLTSRPMIILLLIPAVLGYLLAIRDSGRVVEQFLNTLSWMGLAKYALAIIVIKFIHETAHSLAAMRFNCRVRGVGIGFIFFVPRLYTDTTDSWRLPRKQRLLIDGAGIFAELLIGGIAALGWNLFTPGAWQATMFYIFAVSTLSTLLVNGNVFIRYDGYYILSDLLGIENLMGRASECVKRTWRWSFLRLGAPSGEKRKILLIVYGVSAFVYRIFLYTSICLLIYYKFIKVLAVLLLVLEIFTVLIYPLSVEIKTIRQLSRRSTGKAVWLMLFFVAVISAGILFAPLSWGLVLPGETAPSRRSPVSIEESGYLVTALTSAPVKVSADTVIAKLSSPQLQFSKEKLQRTAEYDRILFVLQEVDEKEFVRNEATARKLDADKLALRELIRREGKLLVRAGKDGFFVPSVAELSPGAFLRRNTQIGEIVSAENTVFAYAGDDQAGKIYPGQKGVVRFADTAEEIPCRVKRMEQVGSRLKSSPVLQVYGGPVPSYQTAIDEFTAIPTLYRIELEIPETKIFSGRSAEIKLSHTERLYTHICKIFLSFLRKEF